MFKTNFYGGITKVHKLYAREAGKKKERKNKRIKPPKNKI